MSTPNLKIALIGAGPASLTLAAILHRHKIPFTIFEASNELRHQGGTLDLHPEDGQQALRDAGLWDEFVKYARPEADCMKLVDLETGEIFWDENTTEKQYAQGKQNAEDGMNGRPEIDREWLVKITYGALPEESVRWGMKLLKVVPHAADEKKHDLHFADGTIEGGFDLVVGGDGAWSKVRNLLTDVKPEYSGISAVELWHNDIKTNPWLLNYVGAGSCFAFAEGSAVISQRQGDGSLRTYACLRVPETLLPECSIDWDKDTAVEQFTERFFSHVSPDLKRVLAMSKDKLTTRVLYELPIGFSYPHRPGVTLIGDAAHLMTPFAGVGVNVGMKDALVLAKEIIASRDGRKTLDEAVKGYEEELWPRAKRYMQKTAEGKEHHFKAGGSREFAEMLRAHHAGQKEE